MRTCRFTDQPHHSDDLFEVWSGRPEPRYVCGYQLHENVPSSETA